MYTLYKIFGKLSKTLSNIMLLILIPLSIILCAVGWALFFIKDILALVIADIDGILDQHISINEIIIEVKWSEFISTTHWVGLGIGLFFALILLVLLLAWIFKKVLYKQIAGFQVTRNKEWRNKDINKAIEKLEDYRYRD